MQSIIDHPLKYEKAFRSDSHWEPYASFVSVPSYSTKKFIRKKCSGDFFYIVGVENRQRDQPLPVLRDLLKVRLL